MITKRSREGELLVDHRAGPGLPPDFWARVGLQGFVTPGGAVAEVPTMTCAHCNAVVVMNMLRTRPRGWCRKCDAYVCDSPSCNHECKPFAEILDEAERAAYRAEQNSALGLIIPKG
jgi:hypothetical protein